MKKLIGIAIVSLFVSGGASAIGTNDLGSAISLDPAKYITSTEFFSGAADIATTFWIDSKSAKLINKRTTELTISVIQSATSATYIGFGTNAQSAQRVKTVKFLGSLVRTIPLALSAANGTTAFVNSTDANVKVTLEILY